MKYLMENLPYSERPRERLIKNGASSLSNYELIAIILRTGTKDIPVLEVAKNLLMAIEDISSLNEITISELRKIDGIGVTKAIELLAAIELGKRVYTIKKEKIHLHNSNDSYHYVSSKFTNKMQECFLCVFLNIKNEVIGEKILSIGTLDRTIIHPRDVLKWALKHSAYAVLVAHNHPSGDPTPSDGDKATTTMLIKALQTVGIHFLDHIVVGDNAYFSFMQNEVINLSIIGMK